MKAKKKPSKVFSQISIKRNKSVIFKDVEGLVYILDHKTMTLKTLNELASFIWRELKTPQTIEKLGEKIYKSYESSKKTILKDLTAFIKLKLKEKELQYCNCKKTKLSKNNS
ncbi:hypothetical protein COT75_01315 [Candidatus Beckwithbacteria bacterium CG10_big_fil_rev_8_21_14_0_10_34_10]|uniref:PqqD family protein n=1 Tax=Candidatus Beckwithbacteria bacterium CG10_big_fil_rev_8_21_14_0_10_34_10 TaxID=1974495 RepID=A0A2H0W9Z4_9BACT|nr:MAG: hypothetical protein COT75_01315 [Candidatus Beckwithbacteria bacterium CG10_big_fil_rev_8_21_14_0_10_34_10]